MRYHPQISDSQENKLYPAKMYKCMKYLDLEQQFPDKLLLLIGQQLFLTFLS